jgi:hypothetical protein
MQGTAPDGAMVGAAMDGLKLLIDGSFERYRTAMEAKEIGNDLGKKVRHQSQ